jgi:hypothetical protein
MRIATVLVVGGHHVRAEAAHERHQRFGAERDVDKAEAPLRQRRRRVALGPSRVDETQPVLAHPEDGPCSLHLVAPDAADVGQHLGPVHAGVEDRPALTPGAGGHVHIHPSET